MTGPRLIGTAEPRSPEWYALREGALGGSDIAVVLGLSPHTSRFTLWHQRAGLVGSDDTDSLEAEWGRRKEPIIAAKFGEQHPEYRVESTGTWAADGRPWQIANPDRLLFPRARRAAAGPRAILEIKTARYGDEWGAEGSDEIPPRYRAQCLWYLSTFQLTECWVAVLIGGFDYREYLVTYDRREAQLLAEAGMAFLRSVREGARPDVDEHDTTYQTIRVLHPEIDGTTVTLPDDLARDYCRSRAALEQVEDWAALCKARVADLMGNAQRAVWDGKTIARRQAGRAGASPFVVAGPKLPWFADEAETDEGAA